MSEDGIISEPTADGFAEAPVEPSEPIEAAGDGYAAESAESSNEDPWESLKGKGYDPAALEKSFTRFTQELESVKAMERELEPVRQLKELLDTDEDVLRAFEEALNAPREGEDEVDVLRRELDGLKNRMATEREIESLKAYATDNGLPPVDERKVLQHAMKNNLGSLRAAYHDMNFEAIRTAERERALNDVKGLQRAATVPTTATSTKATQRFTTADIEGMSSDEFLKNRDAILAQYSN